MSSISQVEFLQAQTAAVLDRCTACGRCIDVCPNRPHLALEGEPALVAGSIVRLLRGEDTTPEAGRFVDACCGSAVCRDACPEGIDPATLMRLGKVAWAKRNNRKPPAGEYHLIDLSVRAQVGSNEPRWYTRRPPADARAETVFYMGCNIMRTPHIALDVMAVLEDIGLDYATVGGGANCCGIKQFRVGLPAAETVSRNTMSNFASLQPKEVVSWCPTCEIHFGHFGANYVEHGFPINHLSRVLARHLEELKSRFRPVPLRVVIEEHAPLGEGDTVREDVRAVLNAIPGLEVMPAGEHVYGYQCGIIALPDLQQAALEDVLTEARRHRADAIVSVYHGCHRFLVKSVIRRNEPFEIVNWISLVARALGRENVDRYQEYARLGDENLILEEAMALDGGQGIPIDKLRQAVQWEFGS